MVQGAYTATMSLPLFSSYSYPTEVLELREVGSIIKTLDRLNDRLGEFSEEFVIIGGANLVLRGIRRATTDVDLLVSDGAYDFMQNFEGAKIKLPPKRALAQGATNTSVWLNTRWTVVPISAATEMGDGYFPISYAKYNDTDLELIGGHACAPLDDVWESKVALQRPKDLPDLIAIAKHTGRSPVLPAPIYQGPYLDS